MQRKDTPFLPRGGPTVTKARFLRKGLETKLISGVHNFCNEHRRAHTDAIRKLFTETCSI